MAIKQPSEKRILTSIVQKGKSLTNMGEFIIHDKAIYAFGNKSDKETIGIHKVEFLESYIEDYLLQLPVCINGTLLNRIISGAKLEVQLEPEFKLTTTKGVYIDIPNEDTYNMILKNVIKYLIISERLNEWTHYEYGEEDIKKLIEDKNFILDLSEYFNLALLKLTNKNFKNLKKDSNKIVISVSNDFISENENIKICKISVYDDISVTTSYYGFLDKALS